MRTSKAGGVGALALAVCLFSSSATCKPVVDRGYYPHPSRSAITTLTGIGNLPAQTITASSQKCTYSEVITTTAITVTCHKTSSHFHKGCFKTSFPTPGVYTIESPQQIDYSCPYSVLEKFDSCPDCKKIVTRKSCQFGYCNEFHEKLDPVNPTSTKTDVYSSWLGWGCKSSLAGGASYQTSLPTITLPTISLPTISPPPLSLPTSTTYLISGSVGFTATIGGTIVLGLPYYTVFSDLPPGVSTGYTSTTGGTIVIGTPSYTPGPYITSTSYLASATAGFTTTIGNSVVVGLPYQSFTVTLPAGASGFTSTASGRIIVGTPSGAGPSITPTPTLPPLAISTITSYFTGDGGAFTTTIGNSVVVGLPYQSFTVTLPAGASGFTSTASGRIIVGTPSGAGPSITPTPTLPPLAISTITSYFTGEGGAFTTTIGSSVIVNLPYATTTITLPVGSGPFTITGTGVVVIGTPSASPTKPTLTHLPVPTITSYSYFTGQGAETTIQVGATVIVELPYVTKTLTLSAGATPYTVFTSGTEIIGSPLPTPTITIHKTVTSYFTGGPGYTSTVSGSIVIVGQPFVTSTSFLDNGESPFTQTEGGTIVVGVPVPTITETTTLAPGLSGYTSIIAASGSVDGTVIIGHTLPYETRTSFLDGGGAGYTSTISGSVIVGVPVPTITETTILAPGLSGYTSIIAASGSVDGTVIIGHTLPYETTTSFLDGGGAGYTSTIGGSVIVGLPVPTITVGVTISAGVPAFTSTVPALGSVPGTVIIGTPAPYASATVYFSGGGSAYTTTTQGSIIVHNPYATVSSYFNPLNGGAASTVTNGGTLTVYVPYAFATSYFATPGPAYSTTISGTIYYVTAYVTSTDYIYSGGPGFTSTNGGSLIVGLPLPTVTITDYFSAAASFSGSGGPEYTSTIAASGAVAGTVVVGFGQGIVTLFSTIGSILATQTIAASGTVAATIIVTVPTACANAGLQMGVYKMPQDEYDNDPLFSDFDPTIYKTLTPSQVDTSTSPFFSCANVPICTITNAVTPLQVSPPTFLAIDYHGYFVAPSTGIFTFSSKNIDDILLVWFGPLAFAGWTRNNANILATYGNYPGTNEVHSFSMPLVQGLYYPIRILYGNGDGPGNFEFDLVGPNAQPVPFTGSNLVEFSCDKILAPPFPAYGSEK